MKFASYNIQFGIGLDGKFDPERIADVVRDADVICLQEVTRHFHRNDNADLVALMAEYLPDRYHYFSPATDIDAGSDIVDGKIVSRRFQFGNMILSRTPILASRTLLLPRHRTFDRLNLQRCATEALIDCPLGPIRVYSVHLDHRDPAERIGQIQALKHEIIHYPLYGGALTGASEFGLPDVPMTEEYVIMGDFNMQPESPEYIAMAGMRDAFYGRSLRASNPCDCLAHFGKIDAGSWSWTDPETRSERQLLDYCFLSPGLALKFKNGWIDMDAEASDHMPLFVELG